jgi:hypothetical protein
MSSLLCLCCGYVSGSGFSTSFFDLLQKNELAEVYANAVI